MHCQYCGAPMDEQDTACSLCGKSVDQQTTGPQAVPSAPEEPVWSENFSTVYQEPQITETRRRGKGPLLTVLGVVLALLVAAGIKFYPDILLAVNPKGYVDLAYNRTQTGLQQSMAHIGTVFGSDLAETFQTGQVGSTVSLALKGIQTDGQPMEIPSDFLDGIHLQAASDIDYEAKRMQGRLTLSLLGEEITALSYADEERLALGLPGLYPRNFGFYGDTFVQDWNASLLGETLPIDEDMQIDLGALFDPSRVLIRNQRDEAEDTPFDLESLNNLMENAVYKSIGKGTMQGGATPYTRIQLTLRGADVKAVVKDLFVQMSALSLFGGQDMSEMLEEMENTSFEDVVVVFYTNGGHRMVGAEMTLTVKDEVWDTEESVVLALALGADADPLDGCRFSGFSADGEELFTLGHDATSSDSGLAGQIYLTVNSGYGAETMTIAYAYAPDTPGENLSVTMDLPSAGVLLTLRGGLHTDRDAKRQTFTLSNITVDDGWQTTSIDLAFSVETFAQSKTVEAWTDVQKVTDMTQEDWDEIMYNLQEKLYSIAPMFTGLSGMM